MLYVSASPIVFHATLEFCEYIYQMIDFILNSNEYLENNEKAASFF
jgi:hypothetical protein